MTAEFARQEEHMTAKPAYQDITLPIEKRVDDLVWRMTLEEKVSQMVYDAPSIERLGVPKYNWWNECLHGVGRAVIEPGEFQVAVGGRQPTSDDFAGSLAPEGDWPCPTHWALALVHLHAHCERRILPLGHGAQTFFLGQS